MFTNRFYKISAIILCSLLVLTTLLCIIISFSLRHVGSYFNVNYSILMCVVCLPVALLISKIGNDLTMKAAHNHAKKMHVIWISVAFHFIEALLVIMPLFICLLVNGVTHDSVFNWLLILLAILAYPITIGAVMGITLKQEHNKRTHA